jgi:plasmid stability protein
LDAILEKRLPQGKSGLHSVEFCQTAGNSFSTFVRAVSLKSLRAQETSYAINAIIAIMASITIRKLPESTKRRLRLRAARNGHSMEQEARELLETALARTEAATGPKSENLGEIIHRRFAALGGVDLKIPPRGPIRDPGIR